jgi:hypothetical protein
MATKQDFESLSVSELKEKLEKIWHKHEKLCRTQMAPLLYHLRLKLKAQGKTGAGFGVWCEDTLDISRRTADRWADEWAISQGLKKPSKRQKRTFRQMSKSAESETAEGNIVVTFQMTLTREENKSWLAALRVLGSGAQKVIFEAVLNAGGTPKKPVASATEADRKRLKFLEEQPDTLLGAMEQAKAQGAGQ